MSTTADRHRPVGAVLPDDLRTLASRGDLASIARSDPEAAVALTREAYAIVAPIVYDAHTRRLERSKGHRDCVASPATLRPACHDGFIDDIDAVVLHMLGSAHSPIENLEGWITSRIRPATVDAHRRRRGERGAQQRPRVPAWLATKLGADPWLTTLAVRILEWAGVEATAGTELWPLDAWGELRAAVTGDHTGTDPLRVLGDVERVLEAMRSTRPRWFERYVEVPLGRKQPPVPPTDQSSDASDGQALELVPSGERDEALLVELAGLALDSIAVRLDAGGDPEVVVPMVVEQVFLGLRGDADLDPAVWSAERIPTVVASVLAILRDSPCQPRP